MIVSEETGGVSISVKGKLQEDINQDELRKVLEGLATGGTLNTQR